MESSVQRGASVPAITRLYLHDAARTGGYADGWETKSATANEEVSGLEKIVERVRDLCRNGSTAATLVEILTNKIVQPGIKLAILTDKGKAERLRNLIYEVFEESNDLDFNEELSFQSIMTSLVEETVKAGGCLAIRVFDATAKLGFRIKLVEQSFIAREYSAKAQKGGGMIRNGIEYDARGKKVAYWIYSHRQNDELLGPRKPERFKISDVGHFFVPTRLGAEVGLPWLSHLVPEIRMLEDFVYNTHIRNRNASAISGIIETTERPRIGGDFSPGSEEFQDGETEKEEAQKTDDRGFAISTKGSARTERRVREDYTAAQFSELRPGIFHILRYGEKVTVPRVPDPPDFLSFHKPRLQALARGSGGASYEDLSGDFSNSSFSSARMSESQPRLWAQKRRELLRSMILSKVWTWTKEGLELKAFNTSRIWHRWEMPEPAPINPKEEAMVMQAAISSLTGSISEFIRRSGRDPDAVFQAIAEDRKKLRQLGIIKDTASDENSSDSREDE